ncbi:MAG: cysteine--tRNA ligase [Microcoleus sp.]
MLRLHNTLTRKTEDFFANDRQHVTLYTCGPTVYNNLHVGNWVAYIRWDTLVRTLVASGYSVERVMNITDVGHLTSDADEGEDKMEKGARREGKTAWDIAKLYTDNFLAGMQKLNLIVPEHLTKATDHIPEQIALIQTLEDKGYTYPTRDGIYFDTSKFKTYADFAHLDLAAQKAGARVEFNPEKKNPSDFALWKLTSKNTKRDMEWKSPWGNGFPGWHLECSAMAMKYLGETIDIHTGGIDHISVHHTNEIAQSEAATGKRFANYWLHANFLMVNGTKISKSLDNGFTLEDLDEKNFSPSDFRMFVLQSHYRTESNFTWENLAAAHNRLRNWRNVANLRYQTHDTLIDDDDKSSDLVTIDLLRAQSLILSNLQDDLNTPEALKVIEEVFTALESKRTLADVQQQALIALLEKIDELFGLKLLETTPDITDDVKQLIIERERARDNKDWKTSDRLRDKLRDRHQIDVKDTPTGPVWIRL